ncbi:MAG: hypothetical protein LZ173_10695 [Thaumarchaeota archaeon]|jgi:hypothetical protein|nr:hypothetical protein [Candidatus Geocrenenecus arthurdayi]
MDYLEELRKKWWNRVVEKNLESKRILVKMKTLKPEEAIGHPARKEYPLLRGKEVMIQADLNGAVGQAFTDEPTDFEGTLRELSQLDIKNNCHRALLVAGINATYRLLGLVEGTRHCKDDGPEKCAEKISEYLYKLHGESKICMIGFQPAIVYNLSKRFHEIRVTDMDEENIGKKYYGVIIEPHTRNFKAIEWSDVVLATGSTLVNNTIHEIIESAMDRPLYFYGVTIAALSYEFGFKRLCYYPL